MSRLDRVYRRLLMSKFFSKGWGNPENIKRLFEFRRILSDRDACQNLVDKHYPIILDKEYESGGVRTLEGHFLSPFATYMPGIVPQEVETARFQMILPSKWTTKHHPVCVQLAGTGDHFYWRRRTLCAKPLLKEYGIASIILENPYYGLRKPKTQRRSCLMNVTDLFVMGGSLILESLALFHWAEAQGWGPLGITGISMGGHMASLAATSWHKPISLIPCLSWSTASCVFTEGVLSGSIPWDVLQTQYTEDSVFGSELRRLFHSPETPEPAVAYDGGQQFVSGYPECIKYNHNNDVKSNLHYPSYPSDLDTNRSVPSGSFVSTNQNRRHNFTDSSANNDDQRHATQTEKPRFGPQIFDKFRRPKSSLQDEALDFMRGVMDEFTHLANFSMPVDPRLVVIVAAKQDAYIPREGVFALDSLWPGSEVRYLNLGHVGSFLFKQAAFRKAINDAFQRQIELHYS